MLIFKERNKRLLEKTIIASVLRGELRTNDSSEESAVGLLRTHLLQGESI